MTMQTAESPEHAIRILDDTFNECDLDTIGCTFLLGRINPADLFDRLLLCAGRQKPTGDLDVTVQQVRIARQ
jgi:hypothetical protein